MRLLFAALILSACGGAGASATFTGTVHGQSMRPSDAISSVATVQLGSGTAPAAAIIIADTIALCTRLAENLEPKSSRALVLFLADVNVSTGAIGAAAGTGTWTIYHSASGGPPAHFATAYFGVNDASCNEIQAQSATAVSGTITLTGNSGGTYAGTYDLTFDSGDHVQGAFETAACQSIATFLAASTHGCG